MTLPTFSLPDEAQIRATNFRPQFLQAVTPIRGGDAQAVELGDMIWLCDIETAPLSRAQAARWKALHLKARGAMFFVWVHDAAAPRPAAYADESADSEWYASEETWFASEVYWLASGIERAWGAPTVVEYDQENSMLKLTDLVAGAVLSVGDKGAWDDGATRYLVEIVEDAVADGDGVAWVRVEPPPPASSANIPSAFMMHEASAEMRIATFNAPTELNELTIVTMTAAQVLRRSF